MCIQIALLLDKPFTLPVMTTAESGLCLRIGAWACGYAQSALLLSIARLNMVQGMQHAQLCSDLSCWSPGDDGGPSDCC